MGRARRNARKAKKPFLPNAKGNGKRKEVTVRVKKVCSSCGATTTDAYCRVCDRPGTLQKVVPRKKNDGETRRARIR